MLELQSGCKGLPCKESDLDSLKQEIIKFYILQDFKNLVVASDLFFCQCPEKRYLLVK